MTVRKKKTIPASLEEALMELNAAQCITLTIQSAEQAKSLKRRLNDWIYNAQSEGVISLDLEVKVKPTPDGRANIIINAMPPIEAEIVEVGKEGEINVVKKFNIIGG